jgi:predicted transcriptional regulator
MGKNPTKKDTMRRANPAKKARDNSIRAEAAMGKTTVEIAKEYGLVRQTVSGILNSDETKDLLKRSENRVKLMVDKALDRLENAIETGEDGTNALKAALAVLKNFGLIKESVDLNHRFPKPLVIKRTSGETVILGTEADVIKGDDK